MGLANANPEIIKCVTTLDVGPYVLPGDADVTAEQISNIVSQHPEVSPDRAQRDWLIQVNYELLLAAAFLCARFVHCLGALLMCFTYNCILQRPGSHWLSPVA